MRDYSNGRTAGDDDVVCSAPLCMEPARIGGKCIHHAGDAPLPAARAAEFDVMHARVIESLGWPTDNDPDEPVVAVPPMRYSRSNDRSVPGEPLSAARVAELDAMHARAVELTAPRPAAVIDAEKASKPCRPDLVSPWFAFFAGRAMAYGASKHGCGLTGRGTFRDPGEQSTIDTHVRSFERHWNAYRRGELVDPESGLLHFDCACAQLSILADLIGDPPR